MPVNYPSSYQAFFVTWFTKGGGYHPHELEIDGAKVWLFGIMV